MSDQPADRSIRLRPAEPADAGRLAEIATAAYGHYVERLGGPPRPMIDDYDALVAEGGITVAEQGGEVVGLILLHFTEEGFSIDNLAVAPDRQGAGVGRALLIHAEDEARRRGFDSVALFTADAMTENLELYERIGYAEYDRRDHGDVVLVHMRKPLA
jgi:ribosomal protein S18 acetylase RimI-like enzyme